jgi:hypothetical protein
MPGLHVARTFTPAALFGSLTGELPMQKSRVRMFGLSIPLAVFVVGASACGGAEPLPAEQPAAQPPAVAPAPARRVFFVEPQDGATVKSPVHLQFGLEGYELAPVPEGEITAAQVRAGLGHHHVGVEQDCLPAGTEIVRGTPNWVHFGQGDTQMDIQLEPGPHKLTLQLGDDLHRTIEGFCQTINITVQK